MGKPGKQQKPAEKAEKKSRAAGRQKPYTRSSTKGKCGKCHLISNDVRL